MITNETGLKQTLESIEKMERAIEDLQRNVLPGSREWFELMAEGSREEIRRLRREVADYKARNSSRSVA